VLKNGIQYNTNVYYKHEVSRGVCIYQSIFKNGNIRFEDLKYGAICKNVFCTVLTGLNEARVQNILTK
jgi:hypothetical protein